MKLASRISLAAAMAAAIACGPALGQSASARDPARVAADAQAAQGSPVVDRS